MKKITITKLQAMKRDAEPLACLTAYDASFARIIDQQGMDVILVGDSLGMVIQGHETTIPVTVEHIIYHARAVASATKNALLMVDMPFMSYTSPQEALQNARRLMQEGGAEMVKLEGGAAQIETVAQLVRYDVPVCAHLGLQPQSIHKLGTYRVQGRQQAVADKMRQDALALQQVGADVLLLECVPVSLAEKISHELMIPVIGIGAGAGCDGQILVLHDVLGITAHAPRFSKDFLMDNHSISAAFSDFVRSVKNKEFPCEEHCFF